LSQKALSKISKIGTFLKIFCFLEVKENALNLYGFLSQKELQSFEFLNNIPSIGPKSALEVASIGSLQEIQRALEREDKKVIEQIYSIGKKKGQRIILEISREIKKARPQKIIQKDEVYQALKNLGFSGSEIKKTLAKIPPTITKAEEKIKEALKILGR
jgi:Holliday junction DNA helicase RuvA